jgi:hypothetical protein
MFQVWSDGTKYAIAPVGEILQGWSIVDSAGTPEEGYAKAKANWGCFWNFCGVVPSFSINVAFA